MCVWVGGGRGGGGEERDKPNGNNEVSKNANEILFGK